MQENKQYFFPAGEPDGADLGLPAQPQEPVEDIISQEPELESYEKDCVTETFSYTPEIPVEPTTYRGMGAGRRESPFADSPYVMQHQAQEPYRPRSEESVPQQEPPRRNVSAKKNGWWKGLVACVAVLALVTGSCILTAQTVNARWEGQTARMEQSFAGQLQALQAQVEAMSPASTGVSVSGTVAVADGYTAGQVYARNVHSVVLIESTVVSNVYGQTATGTSSGSGFILTEDGYVITNYHVVEGASSVKVVLYDGLSHPAQLVGSDSTNDIALLKIKAVGLDAVELGSSDALIVGDQVVAIGNPLGELTSTLTVGYVSAKERTVNTDGTIINMIQTDAAINSGNSGGPLFNMKGQVVGITTAKYSGSSSSGASIEGIGFAIPIDDVVEEIEQLKQFGYIKSAYLGVWVMNMDAQTANVYGLPVGAYVDSVEPGYCAQKAGIQAKDIIIGVGPHKVESLTDLTRALREFEPGDTVVVTVYRSGSKLELKVTLDERPANVDAGSSQQTQPDGQMPEGDYWDWFEYFSPFFGNGGG